MSVSSISGTVARKVPPLTRVCKEGEERSCRELEDWAGEVKLSICGLSWLRRELRTFQEDSASTYY